jgi:hypothetical protein
MATTFGFSFLQGPHQEAQKSIIVTFPKDSFNDITLPSGVFAEKSGAKAPTSTWAVTFFFVRPVYSESFSISKQCLFLF